MDSFSEVALVLLALVAFSNYRNGTLGQWLKAKFLNQTPGSSGGASSSGSASVELATSKPVADVTHQVTGTLMAPVSARITSGFGVDRGDHKHAGIDYGAAFGTQVQAAAAGTVIAAGPSGAYGNKVDVDHGAGVVTRYAHLSSIAVTVGQHVDRGQTLGRVGATGRATGPHLHFEVRVAGVSVNPLDWLRPRAVDAAVDVGKAAQVWA